MEDNDMRATLTRARKSSQRVFFFLELQLRMQHSKYMNKTTQTVINANTLAIILRWVTACGGTVEVDAIDRKDDDHVSFLFRNGYLAHPDLEGKYLSITERGCLLR